MKKIEKDIAIASVSFGIALLTVVVMGILIVMQII